MNDLAKAAAYYSQLGLAIFPLHPVINGRCNCLQPHCDAAGKHPVGANWQRTIPSAHNHTFWPSHTHRGIGLLCGPPSRCFALDIDPRHGGQRSLSDLERQHGSLPRTWEATTGGGGQHLYFQWPAGAEVRNSAGRLGTGLDIRGRGGFTVLPPSSHATGRRYHWHQPPGRVALAPAPDWLLEQLQAPATLDRRPTEPGQLVEPGRRHDALVSLLGLARSWGATEPVLVGLAELFLEHQCAPDPPPDVDAARQTARWIATNYHVNPRARTSIHHHQDHAA